MSPRGKQEVTPAEAQQWFEGMKSGESMAKIARDSGRDPRTVKRAVQFYAASLEMEQVRKDSLRAALDRHYTDLLQALRTAGEHASSRAVPSFDRVPVGNSRPGMLMPYRFVIDWKDRFRASARYQEDETPVWKMMGSHLGRDPVWSRYRSWRDAGSQLAGQMLVAFHSIVASLTEATGLKLARGDEAGIVTAGMKHLFDGVMDEAAGNRGRVNRLLRSFKTDERGLWVENSWQLLQTDEPDDSLANHTRSALGSPEFGELVAKLARRITTCREAGREFAEEIEFVAAVPHLGGVCRGCERIAL